MRIYRKSETTENRRLDFNKTLFIIEIDIHYYLTYCGIVSLLLLTYMTSGTGHHISLDILKQGEVVS